MFGESASQIRQQAPEESAHVWIKIVHLKWVNIKVKKTKKTHTINLSDSLQKRKTNPALHSSETNATVKSSRLLLNASVNLAQEFP